MLKKNSYNIELTSNMGVICYMMGCSLSLKCKDGQIYGSVVWQIINGVCDVWWPH